MGCFISRCMEDKADKAATADPAAAPDQAERGEATKDVAASAEDPLSIENENAMEEIPLDDVDEDKEQKRSTTSTATASSAVMMNTYNQAMTGSGGQENRTRFTRFDSQQSASSLDSVEVNNLARSNRAPSDSMRVEGGSRVNSVMNQNSKSFELDLAPEVIQESEAEHRSSPVLTAEEKKQGRKSSFSSLSSPEDDSNDIFIINRDNPGESPADAESAQPQSNKGAENKGFASEEVDECKERESSAGRAEASNGLGLVSEQLKIEIYNEINQRLGPDSQGPVGSQNDPKLTPDSPSVVNSINVELHADEQSQRSSFYTHIG